MRESNLLKATYLFLFFFIFFFSFVVIVLTFLQPPRNFYHHTPLLPPLQPQTLRRPDFSSDETRLTLAECLGPRPLD